MTLVDDLRRWVTRLMQRFLECALESQFIILEHGDAGDDFIQVKRNHRILYGEVGSREWDVDRPIASRRMRSAFDPRASLGADPGIDETVKDVHRDGGNHDEG